MFKILIVDDEYRTRQGIKKLIDFKTLDITEVEEADDGVNGLEKAKVFKPDIIVSDIKMPRVDGIAFAFEVKKILPNCRLIFMSAYTELDYYKSAIKLNAISYIEKPIDLDELTTAIKNALRDIKQYMDFKSLKEEVDELRETNKDLALRQLSAMMITRKINLDQLNKKMDEVGITLPFEGEFVTMIANHIYKEHLDPNEQDTVKNTVDDLLYQISLTSQLGFAWHFKQNQLIINCWSKVNQSKQLNNNQLKILAKELYLHLLSFCQPTLSIGKVVNHVENIYDSYTRAVVTNEKLFFRQGEMIEMYQSNTKETVYTLNQNDLDDFSKLIEQGKKAKAIIYAKNLYAELLKNRDTPINSVKKIYYKHCLAIYWFIKEEQEQFDEMILNVLNQLNTLMELDDYLRRSINHYFKQMTEQSKKNTLTEKVKRYIKENYMDTQLSLDHMAEQLSITSSYLNVVFKKEVGMTIHRYLTHYRMNKAKELLKKQEVPISEVALLIGYADRDYFSRIFKKEVGCTASEYRKKILI